MGHLIKPTQCAQYTEAYHWVQKAVDEFSQISPNIPTVMLEVVRHIYGRFDEAAYRLFRAGNEDIASEKVKHLTIAQSELFYQFSSLETIVRGKGLTVKAANNVLTTIKEARDQTVKWLEYEKRKAWNDEL